jgi:hypothetical protein
LFIAYLAGVLSTGGGSGGNTRATNTDQKEQVTYQEETRTAQAGQTAVTADSEQKGPEDEQDIPPQDNAWQAFIEKGRNLWESYTYLAILAILLFLGLILFFIWLNARFQFVWLHAVVHNSAEITRPFKEFSKEGNALFRFHLYCWAVLLVVCAINAGWIIVILKRYGFFAGDFLWSFSTALLLFLLPAVSFMASLFIMLLFAFLFNNMVIPIMMHKRAGVLLALGESLRLLLKNKKNMFFYACILIGLYVATGILTMVMSIVVFLGVAAIGGILFGLPYLLLIGLLKWTPVFIVYAVILGIPFAFCMIILFMSIGLPFAVFFRVFSLKVLGLFEGGYALLPAQDQWLPKEPLSS